MAGHFEGRFTPIVSPHSPEQQPETQQPALLSKDSNNSTVFGTPVPQSSQPVSQPQQGQTAATASNSDINTGGSSDFGIVQAPLTMLDPVTPGEFDRPKMGGAHSTSARGQPQQQQQQLQSRPSSIREECEEVQHSVVTGASSPSSPVMSLGDVQNTAADSPAADQVVGGDIKKQGSVTLLSPVTPGAFMCPKPIHQQQQGKDMSAPACADVTAVRDQGQQPDQQTHLHSTAAASLPAASFAFGGAHNMQHKACASPPATPTTQLLAATARKSPFTPSFSFGAARRVPVASAFAEGVNAECTTPCVTAAAAQTQAMPTPTFCFGGEHRKEQQSQAPTAEENVSSSSPARGVGSETNSLLSVLGKSPSPSPKLHGIRGSPRSVVLVSLSRSCFFISRSVLLNTLCSSHVLLALSCTRIQTKPIFYSSFLWSELITAHPITHRRVASTQKADSPQQQQQHQHTPSSLIHTLCLPSSRSNTASPTAADTVMMGSPSPSCGAHTVQMGPSASPMADSCLHRESRYTALSSGSACTTSSGTGSKAGSAVLSGVDGSVVCSGVNSAFVDTAAPPCTSSLHGSPMASTPTTNNHSQHSPSSSHSRGHTQIRSSVAAAAAAVEQNNGRSAYRSPAATAAAVARVRESWGSHEESSELGNGGECSGVSDSAATSGAVSAGDSTAATSSGALELSVGRGRVVASLDFKDEGLCQGLLPASNSPDASGVVSLGSPVVPKLQHEEQEVLVMKGSLPLR